MFSRIKSNGFSFHSQCNPDVLRYLVIPHQNLPISDTNCRKNLSHLPCCLFSGVVQTKRKYKIQKKKYPLLFVFVLRCVFYPTGPRQQLLNGRAVLAGFIHAAGQGSPLLCREKGPLAPPTPHRRRRSNL